MDNIDPQSVPDFTISPEEQARIKQSVKEDNEKEYFQELALQHRKDSRLTEEHIVDAFPTDQVLVVAKIEEYWEEAKKQYVQVRKIRNIVDNIQTDPFSKWFFINAEKYEAAANLKWLYQQLKRLQRLKVTYEKHRVEALLAFTKFDTKEERRKYNIDKMFAKEGLLIDIVSYDGMKLRRSGNRFSGLCPFHNESTGSFFIYADNWYHCYGCQAHGNMFDYVMKKRNISFKEALVEVDRFL